MLIWLFGLIETIYLWSDGRKMTEKYEVLQDLCEAFDNFSESERKLNLFKYLGFSRRDAIPDQYYEDPDDLETVPQ